MFEYTETNFEKLRECLSPERLKPYMVKARGDSWTAFHLYVRNMEISSSLFGVLHALEVGLRNRTHSKMVASLRVEEWWSALPLRPPELSDIGEAKQNIARRARQITADRIVAELNFGFWVKLFSKNYEKSLWVPYLNACFPAGLSRKSLHGRLIEIKEIRNRIAHHETLISRDSRRDYSEMMETIGWISPELRDWVEGCTNFIQIVERRIPKPPKVTAGE